MPHIKMTAQKPMIRCPGLGRIFFGHELAHGIYFGIQIVDVMQYHRFNGFRWFRRAECGFAMVADNHVFQQIGVFTGDIGNFPEFLIKHFEPDNDMTQQTSLIGIIDGRRVIEFTQLADIVQNSAGNQQIPIQPVIMRRNLIRQNRHGQAVHHKPPEIGMMHAFGRRCFLETATKSSSCQKASNRRFSQGVVKVRLF